MRNLLLSSLVVNLSNNGKTKGLVLYGLITFCFTGFILLANYNADHILMLSLEYPGMDKAAHFIVHIILVTCLYGLCRKLWPLLKTSHCLLAVFILSLFLGLIDELQQLFISNRDFNPEDLLANTCGALSAVILITVGKERILVSALMLSVPLATMYLLTQHTRDSSLYYSAGLIHIKNKNYSAARQEFLNAISHNEQLPALFNELAWIEMEHLQTDPAISLNYTQRAISAEPDNANFMDTHGWALFLNGHYQQALGYLRASYQSDKKIYCINYHLGATYHALGMHSQAMYHLQAQLTMNNHDRFAQRSKKLLEKLNKNRKSRLLSSR